MLCLLVVKMNSRKKKPAKEERADLPLLFNPDPGQNFSAWMHRAFPASTIDPKDAIRLWLSGHENTAGINAQTPVTRALFETAGPPYHLSDRPQVPPRSYDPTTHHIQEAVSAALAVALGKDPSLSFTSSNHCDKSDQVHLSQYGFVGQDDIGSATPRAVQPDHHSSPGNTAATKSPSAPSVGLRFGLPIAPLRQLDLVPDNQSHGGLDSGTDHDLGSAVSRKIDGTLAAAQPLHPNERELVEILLSRSTSRSGLKEEQIPGSDTAPRGEIASAIELIGSYWDRHRSDIYLATSILILLTVMLASSR
jgi:hypothetical protein